MSIESFSTTQLAQVAPSYLYYQYQDDDDLQAFVQSYNSIAQGYIDWFNSTPLGVYTSPSISGPLLDWVGSGVYGIARPYISSSKNQVFGATDSKPTNKYATNKHVKKQSGSSVIVDDDIYKRVLTWHLYKGDGMQATLIWLKKRIARFCYGPNGADVSIDSIYNIGLSIPTLSSVGATGTAATNTIATNTLVKRTSQTKHTIQITIPTSSAAQAFSTLLESGYLNLPFQVNYTVTLT